ncbi:MAG TPA: hypothetical protein VKS21_11130, partial [Spirochaetota bacterium]|nr:hypothetical protein [Spirochaetota bacterium]
ADTTMWMRLGVKIIPVSRFKSTTMGEIKYNFTQKQLAEISACQSLSLTLFKYLNLGLGDRLVKHPRFLKNCLFFNLVPKIKIKKILQLCDRNRLQYTSFSSKKKSLLMYRNMLKVLISSGFSRLRIFPLIVNEIYIKKGGIFKNCSGIGFIAKKIGLSFTLSIITLPGNGINELQTLFMFAYPVKFNSKKAKIKGT